MFNAHGGEMLVGDYTVFAGDMFTSDQINTDSHHESLIVPTHTEAHRVSTVENWNNRYPLVPPEKT